MQAPAEVEHLVRRFSERIEEYRNPHYNETQLRRDFIDPLFGALGWDVDNRSGRSEPLREVVHEDRLRIDGTLKAPDYSFRTGGRRRFFLEAKKPAVPIKTRSAPAFQLRRYGWTAKLPVSVLTDFGAIALYDCRVRPTADDAASKARLRYLESNRFIDDWDQLAGLLHRDAVLAGSLDALVATDGARRGTQEVDAAFLHEIEGWRAALARNLARRNPGLGERSLNFAVQRIIDRIVFLRMGEDRGLEPYGQLRDLLGQPDIYARLLPVFRSADDRYNAGLFHFDEERGRGTARDTITPGLTVDDSVLRDIVGNLYLPRSPYAFSVLSADILGQVYERFLGKRIRLTTTHQAKVEDKPAVKKAGGVFYTPTPVVNYIVNEVLGPILGDKRPSAVAGLRVCDPACGSGSFLLGAYQYLLDWYTQAYVERGTVRQRQLVYRGRAGEWRLATSERKRILVQHIFGVDKDLQAVEVTKLSLLLKVLEGESSDSLNRQLTFFKQRALPDLDRNIQCGNSLVGLDFYAAHPALSDDDDARVRPFDWHSAFPQVFDREKPGFDAIVGNPPYIRVQAFRQFAPLQASWLPEHYASARTGMFDVYMAFVERGWQLLRKAGRLGYILPNKFFALDAGAGLRGLLSDAGAVHKVVDFRHHQVFAQATTYTCLLFLARNRRKRLDYSTATPTQLAEAPDSLRVHRFDKAALGSAAWGFASKDEASLLERLSDGSVPLLDLPASMARGSSTGADPVFCLRSTADGLFTRQGDPVDIESGILRTPVFASDFGRFRVQPSGSQQVITPYITDASGTRLMTENDLQETFPKAHAYLASRRRELERRKGYRRWFAFSAPRSLPVHASAHMLVPLLANKPAFAPAAAAEAGPLLMMASGGFSVRVDAPQVDPWLVLGLLNSGPLWWQLRFLTRNNRFRGDYVTCTKQYFGQLCIRLPEPAKASQIAELAHALADLHGRDVTGLTDGERSRLQRRRLATERQLHDAAADLYRLSKAHRRLVAEELALAGQNWK